VEHTLQTIDPYDQFDREADLESARIDQTDLLPAVSAIWSATKKTKLRASVTRTLARPQLRELAPFEFQDYFGGRVVGGNPNLEMTRITNVDTRLEHFPTLKDVLAFSLFFKQFENPIEPVILSGGAESFRNAEGATLIGVELEARRGLDFIPASAGAFSGVVNLTLAHSRIQIRDEATIELTNLSRPLVNQAPWVLNFALDYTRDKTSARLLYNVVGPRVAQVGSAGLDDVYEHPRSILDVTVQQKLGENLSLKFDGRNLLNSEVLLTQGCGSDGLFGSTWHLSCSNDEDDAVTRYTEGVSFAVSASYDF
jgi:outer membrane receptor protein involved in Fe transport